MHLMLVMDTRQPRGKLETSAKPQPAILYAQTVVAGLGVRGPRGDARTSVGISLTLANVPMERHGKTPQSNRTARSPGWTRMPGMAIQFRDRLREKPA